MIDMKDKKIIYALDVDGFKSLSNISKNVGLSKRVVSYRLQNLYKKNIIKNIYTIIDLERLQYEGQKVYFRMQNITQEKEKELIDYFNKNSYVVWFGIYEGRFDFVISIFTRGKMEFDRELSKISFDLKEYIIDFDVSIYTGVMALKKKYLSDSNLVDEFSYFAGKGEQIMLDEKDRNILRILAKDARMSVVNIANELSLSSDVVIARIKKMKRNRVIQGSRVMLNKKKLGIHEFKLLLRLKHYNDSVHKKFLAFARQNRYIAAYIKCIGPWNLEIDVEIPDLQYYHELIMEMKTLFADSITTIESLMIYDEYKYNFYPFLE